MLARLTEPVGYVGTLKPIGKELLMDCEFERLKRDNCFHWFRNFAGAQVPRTTSCVFVSGARLILGSIATFRLGDI